MEDRKMTPMMQTLQNAVNALQNANRLSPCPMYEEAVAEMEALLKYLPKEETPDEKRRRACLERSMEHPVVLEIMANYAHVIDTECSSLCDSAKTPWESPPWWALSTKLKEEAAAIRASDPEIFDTLQAPQGFSDNLPQTGAGCWPLRAKVWKRSSTSEWVLEIEGTLNGVAMNCRHTQPLSVAYEDVPGLPAKYTSFPMNLEGAAPQPSVMPVPVCWLKHGPYEGDEPLSVVFEDPKDPDCFSALGYIVEPALTGVKTAETPDGVETDQEGYLTSETLRLHRENAELLKQIENYETALADALEFLAKEPEWIVNDLGELGVKVNGRFFFLYKGYSLEYGKETDQQKDGVALHDDDTPLLYRMVGKVEFGETCWPVQWVTRGFREDRYTQDLKFEPGLSDGKPEDAQWKPLPCAPSCIPAVTTPTGTDTEKASGSNVADTLGLVSSRSSVPVGHAGGLKRLKDDLATSAGLLKEMIANHDCSMRAIGEEAQRQGIKQIYFSGPQADAINKGLSIIARTRAFLATQDSEDQTKGEGHD